MLRLDLLHEFVLSIPDVVPSVDDRKELLLDEGKFREEESSFVLRRFPRFECLPLSEEFPEPCRMRRKLDADFPLDSSSLFELNRNDDPSKFMPDLLNEPDLPGLQDIFTVVI